MGLDNVVTEVRRDGEARAEEIRANAKHEADSLLAAAREKAKAHEKARLAEADRDAEQVLLQARSRAQSEARKIVLQTEAALREELRASVLAAFDGLDDKARAAHVEALLQRAHKIVPEGRVMGAARDKKALESQKTFEYGGETPVAGGIIVESTDGTTRLDLSYETLLADMWRDVLRSEAALFA